MILFCFSGLLPGWSLSHNIEWDGFKKMVSVGCCPDGHFHYSYRFQFKDFVRFSGLLPGWSLSHMKEKDSITQESFSGLLPGWSLSLLGIAVSGDTNKFQWAVARMVTCFQNSYFSSAHPLSRFTHFEHCRTRPWIARSGMLPGWSLSHVKPWLMRYLIEFQWAVARMVTFTLLFSF